MYLVAQGQEVRDWVLLSRTRLRLRNPHLFLPISRVSTVDLNHFQGWHWWWCSSYLLTMLFAILDLESLDLVKLYVWNRRAIQAKQVSSSSFAIYSALLRNTSIFSQQILVLEPAPLSCLVRVFSPLPLTSIWNFPSARTWSQSLAMCTFASNSQKVKRKPNIRSLGTG